MKLMNAIQAQVEPLRFRVRDGLVVHRKSLFKRKEVGREISEPRTESYGDAFSRSSIDLRPDELKTYAHALEPTDERSAAALTALHFKLPERAEEVSYEARLATQVASATIQALIAAGMLKAPRA
jgi:hypothetical protein